LEDDQYRKELRATLGDERYRMAVTEQLLQEYQNDVYLQCVRWLDPVYGEDVAQEVFLQAWQGLLRYRGDSAIKTWLFGIAKNECRKFLRDRNLHRRLREAWSVDIRKSAHGEEPSSPEDQLRSAEEQENERQQMASLAACIEQLPDRDGLLVTWRYLKARSVSEISDFLDEKPDAIYKRLRRALQKLEKCMSDERQKGV
jgi:RNA polymerase sigma-70 factor (ECF subfamily)